MNRVKCDECLQEIRGKPLNCFVKMKGLLLLLLALLCTITFAENAKTTCDKQYAQCINNAVNDNDKSNMKLCIELYLTCAQYSDNSS